MAKTVSNLALYVFICVNIVLCFQRQCDNDDSTKDTLCTDTHFKEIHCDICSDIFNTSRLKCSWKYDEITFETFVSRLPDDTQYLQVNVETLFGGILPFRSYDICLGYLSKLQNLMEFSLQTAHPINPLSFVLNMTKEEIDNFKHLQNLTLLRINIPLVDKRIILGSIIKSLPNLKVINLSNTCLLGKRNIEDIISNMNQSGVRHLCLRQFQIPGGDDYLNNFTSIDIIQRVSLLTLQEIDIGENGIANFPPVLSRFAPNLKYFDCSFNMLLDAKNWAGFVDMFLHPTITDIRLNNQGFLYMPNTVDQIQVNHLNGLNVYSIVFEQYSFTKDCLNSVSSGNISRFSGSGEKACYLASCLFPTYLYSYDCTNAKTFPALDQVLCFECVLYIKIPIGQNLKSIHYSNLEFDKVLGGGLKKFSQKGYFVLDEPNSLQQIIFHNNFDKIAPEERGFSDNIIGFQNLNNLSYIDFSKNDLSMKLTSNSKFISLKYVDISQNNLTITEFCEFAPNLRFLNLSHNNLRSISIKAMHSCSYLEILDLSNNKQISYKEYDKLDFSYSRRLTTLILSHNDLPFLNEEFLNKLDSFSNLTIDLQQNKLVCNCTSSSKTFIKWLVSKKKQFHIVEFDQLYCAGFSGFTFLSSIENTDSFFRTCHENKWEILGLSIGFSGGLILTIVVFVLWHKWRWRIKYNLFKLRQNLPCRCYRRSSSEEIGTYDYDAFIAYSSIDRIWVHDQLTKVLEDTYGLRLCIHYRDFPMGGALTDIIITKMDLSRYIIFVASNGSIQSDWWNFEINYAFRKGLKSIVIILNDLTKAHIKSNWAYLFDKHMYLQWDWEGNEKLFWENIVNKLRGNEFRIGLCCCHGDPESLGYRAIFEENSDDNCEIDTENNN